uniref:Cadherin domain-containing protein n=1 Tax=Strigops habroptila TaxID=2489341 RepID=A0A672TXE7_STRHB
MYILKNCQLFVLELVFISPICLLHNLKAFVLPRLLNHIVPVIDLKGCLQSAKFISSSDGNFKILEDGSVYTTTVVSLSAEKKTFTILLKDIQEQVEKKIHVSLAQTQKTRHARDTVLKRTKRRWGPIPSVMIENSLGPFPLQIQQVQSDTAQNYTIYYSASGPGIDQDPKGLFYIERETGNIFATRAVDREQYPSFQIICFATTPDGYSPEVPLVHTIRIEDDNDNAPYFTQDLFEFSVPENSKPGVIVGKVTAEDRDEPYTLHTTLKYRIVSQNPPVTPAFSLHSDTGVIAVLLPQLDRELVPSYTLLVEVRDMAGQPFGLCTTGTAVIRIEDMNDNAPSFRQMQYETRVEENRVNVEILRLSVVDLDEPGSPGSGAVYEIIKGNDDRSFEITTDKNTNEGILCVVKVHRNGTARGKFVCLQVFAKSNYFYLIDGKTGTGTIQVFIVPGNKNYPRITKTEYIMCRDRKPICLTAQDGDESPYSTPFVYRITDRSLASISGFVWVWFFFVLFFFSDNSVYLSPKGDIPFGTYDIPISVIDNGGKVGENHIKVNLCDCVTPTECNGGQSRELAGGNVTLGVWAILAMILGSLLLLLILITICGCCGSGVMHRHVTDDCANHNLIISNTEAPGEEVMVSCLFTSNTCDQGGYGIKTGDQQTFEMTKGRGHTLESVKGGGHQTLGSVKEGGGQTMMDTCRYSYSEWHNFTHPRLGEKVHLCRQDEEQKHSEDYLLSYNYEGKGSLAGSVGCCSDQHEEEALDFLDQLEPKFRTLAETCVKR